MLKYMKQGHSPEEKLRKKERRAEKGCYFLTCSRAHVLFLTNAAFCAALRRFVTADTAGDVCIAAIIDVWMRATYSSGPKKPCMGL